MAFRKLMPSVRSKWPDTRDDNSKFFDIFYMQYRQYVITKFLYFRDFRDCWNVSLCPMNQTSAVCVQTHPYDPPLNNFFVENNSADCAWDADLSQFGTSCIEDAVAFAWPKLISYSQPSVTHSYSTLHVPSRLNTVVY